MLTRWNSETRRRFIALVAETGSVIVAARHLGVSRTAVYDRMARDGRFREEVEDARDAARDSLRQEAWRRAMHGVEQPLIQGGAMIHDDHGQIVMVRRYSDGLLLKLIKQLRAAAETHELLYLNELDGINPV